MLYLCFFGNISQFGILSRMEGKESVVLIMYKRNFEVLFQALYQFGTVCCYLTLQHNLNSKVL